MKTSYERDRMYDNKTDKSNRFQIKALDRKSKSQAFSCHVILINAEIYFMATKNCSGKDINFYIIVMIINQ